MALQLHTNFGTILRMATDHTPLYAVASFKTAFCEHFRCLPDAFQRKLFWKAVDPFSRPFAFLIRCVKPGFFRKDFELLEQLGEAVTRRDFTGQANGIRADQALNFGFLRRMLRVRISGSRLIRLRDHIMLHRVERRRAQGSS